MLYGLLKYFSKLLSKGICTSLIVLVTSELASPDALMVTISLLEAFSSQKELERVNDISDNLIFTSTLYSSIYIGAR